jgi:hypothetical protein
VELYGGRLREIRCAVIDCPVVRYANLLALLAAIMLVFAGAPSRAETSGCDPCPPDCPMMKASTDAQPHQKAPKADESPCTKAVAACATAIALPVASQREAITWLSASEIRQDLLNEARAPSRPPDRALRPPIQL